MCPFNVELPPPPSSLIFRLPHAPHDLHERGPFYLWMYALGWLGPASRRGALRDVWGLWDCLPTGRQAQTSEVLTWEKAFWQLNNKISSGCVMPDWVILCKCALQINVQKGAAHTHFTLKLWHDKQSSVGPEGGSVVQAFLMKISLYGAHSYTKSRASKTNVKNIFLFNSYCFHVDLHLCSKVLKLTKKNA